MNIEEKRNARFTITDGKGFHITFANGVTVSVQFGAMLYCEHHALDYRLQQEIIAKTGKWTSKDAEVAAWDKDGNWITKQWRDTGDIVIGYLVPADVLDLLNWASNWGKKG